MKVLFVCNNAFNRGNGLSTSIRVTTKYLRQADVDVRLMSVANSEPRGHQPYYPLKHFVFPIFEFMMASNGFAFAKFDEKMAREAIAWADVIHFEEPFPLERKMANIAREMGKPCVATFHLFTQNIMLNIVPLKMPLTNWILLQIWKKTFNKCKYVQCPSAVVNAYLTKNKFKSKLMTIPNGVILPREHVVAEAPVMDPIQILFVGRLSREKAPEVLMQAIKYSKHADRIQLHFAGCGPRMNHYKRLSDKLYRKGVFKHPAIFGFYTKDELKEIARKAYLYIHCAVVEVEGLSCIEAIREGLVPIISEGPMVTTSQFALDERSRYPIKNSKVLAQKIDWWIEHPEERIKMGQEYADSVAKYRITKSIHSLVQMYELAIEEK